MAISDDDVLLQLAYEKWRVSEAATERAYQRSTATGTLAVVVSAAAYAITSHSLVDKIFDRIDIFIYYGAALLVVYYLTKVWYHLARSLKPISSYADLAPLANFCSKYSDSVETEPIVRSAELRKELIRRIGEMELKNRSLDSGRLSDLREASFCLIRAAFSLLLLGVFRFVLDAQGLIS